MCSDLLALNIYGPGMHQAVLDEAELGERVARALDVENTLFGADGMVLLSGWEAGWE